MSNIEELIEQLCAEGVEFRELGEMCEFMNGKGHEKHIIENGKYIVVNSKFVSTGGNVKKYSDQQISPIFINDILMVMSDLPKGKALAKCFVVDKNDKFTLNQRIGAFTVKDRSKTDSMFLYYILNRNKQLLRFDNGSDQTNLRKDDILKISIPNPPLPIQQKIVTILDQFTQLQAELEAELHARRAQYEYYRNQLLNFEGKEVEWAEIDKVFHIRNGYTPSKAKVEYWTNGTIPWFRMDDIRTNGRILSDSIQHISPEAVKGNKLFPANSIIVSTSATIGEHALLTVDSLANQRFTYLTRKGKYLDKLDIKYFFYYMFILDEWCKININISGFAGVDMSKFKKYRIPIPPLAEQNRIVSILDQFDKLVNDKKEGLPAEIEARRKQYEYYRGKLLDFKRMNN